MKGPTIPAIKRNHGIPLNKTECGRCEKDISGRHGNARYCEECSGQRNRPYVVSLRVSKEEHEFILNHGGPQAVLGRLLEAVVGLQDL